MATDYKSNLLDWLRDAHAMEQQAETMLKTQAERLENYPLLRARIELHLQETLGQQKMLEEAISRAGGTTSVLKDMAAKVVAFGQGLSGMMTSDEVVKGAAGCYVFENMEIASYTVLVAAADAAGDLETKRMCEQILEEEVAMAAWLLTHLAELTQAFLARDAAPNVEAKR